MKTYKINLNNIGDFKKYADLFEICKFSAVVSGENFRIDASDIAELFCHWPYKCLFLTITDIHRGNLNDVESYLAQSGLLVSEVYQWNASNTKLSVVG